MESFEMNKRIRGAIKRGDVDEVIALIGNDQSLRDAMTPFGTWLHVAATYGQLAIVRWLLEAGIELNRRGGIAGGNALNEAAEEGHLDIVRYLLSAGADMDVSDPQRNPLFAAIQTGSLDIVKLLLEHGIDATVRYTGEHMKDMDAHAFAIEHGKREIAAYIQDWIGRHGG